MAICAAIGHSFSRPSPAAQIEFLISALDTFSDSAFRSYITPCHNTFPPAISPPATPGATACPAIARAARTLAHRAFTATRAAATRLGPLARLFDRAVTQPRFAAQDRRNRLTIARTGVTLAGNRSGNPNASRRPTADPNTASRPTSSPGRLPACSSACIFIAVHADMSCRVLQVLISWQI